MIPFLPPRPPWGGGAGRWAAALPRVLAAVVLACAVPAAAGPAVDAPPGAGAGDDAGAGLPADATVEREITGGGEATFQLAARGPSYLALEVSELGADLRVALRRNPEATGTEAAGAEATGTEGTDGPAGDGAVDLPPLGADGGRWDRYPLTAILPEAGTYRLTVRAAPDAGGRYRLRLRELRPLRPDDGERVEAEHRMLRVRLAPTTDDVAEMLRRVDELEAVADRFDRLDDPGRRAEALMEMADAILETAELATAARDAGQADGLRRRAAEAAEAALDLRRRLGDAAGQAEALLFLARALGSRSEEESERSLALMEEASRLAARTDADILAARIDNDLGSAYLHRRRPRQAQEPLKRAVAGFRAIGHARNEAIALTNLGTSHRHLGDATLGCLFIERAAALDPEPGILLNLGYCHRQAGRIDAAMTTFQHALRRAEEEREVVNEGRSWLHIGSLLAELGEYERARAALDEARPRLGNSRDLAAVDKHRGWLDVAQGRPGEAVAAFRQVIEEFAGETQAQGEVRDARESLGYALAELGRYREALEQLEELLPPAGPAPADAAAPAPPSSSLLRLIGRARMELGDLEAAEGSLRASLAAAEGQPAHRGAAHSALARLLARRGRLDEARDHVARSIEIQESLRSAVAPPLLRASYLARWRDDFSLWIDLLVRQARMGDADGGRPELLARAFEVSEQAHARTLRELLYEAGSGPAPDDAPARARERRELQDELAELSDRLDAVAEAGGEALRSRIADIERRLSELDWQRRRPFADRPEPPPLTVDHLRAWLGEDEALLEYTLGKERSYLFVVTRWSLRVHPLPPADALAERVEQARSALSTPRLSRLKRALPVLHSLHVDLLTPALEDLEGIRRLIVVPDRELFYLPFEALLGTLPGELHRPEELTPHYLLASRDVGYVPSANVLVQLGSLGTGGEGGPAAGGAGVPRLVAFADSRGGDGDGAPGDRVAARGGPDRAPEAAPDGDAWEALPGARGEVDSIAGLLPADRVRVHVGTDATLGRVHDPETLLADWLHFAVHGDMVADQPLRSGLVMADGRLTVQDIYDLPLGADLAVLSACQTGLGKAVWGEELIGLTRAFFFAGVPTVVVSLWQVSDRSTASLMGDLYARLIRDQAVVPAMAAAKRALLDDERWRHPYYWAPFVVMGLSRGGTVAGNAPASDSPKEPSIE